MSPSELYEATRGVWWVGKDREKAKYAFAVYEGIVREVYQIRQWFPAGSTFYATRERKDVKYKNRWEFVGTVAPDGIRDKYLGTSVGRYFHPRARNPIQYVNVD
jgi:hypothetical protein